MGATMGRQEPAGLRGEAPRAAAQREVPRSFVTAPNREVEASAAMLREAELGTGTSRCGDGTGTS